MQGNTGKHIQREEIKCVCLNARSIINKKKELNIMVDDIQPHTIGITESWANNDITDAELGLEGYAMFRKDNEKIHNAISEVCIKRRLYYNGGF